MAKKKKDENKKLTKKEKKKMETLRKKVLDENGDHKPDASFEDTTELAMLEARDKNKTQKPKTKGGEKDETSKPEPLPKKVFADGDFVPKPELVIKVKTKRQTPKRLRHFLDKGYQYLGCDTINDEILYHPEEGNYYRVNRNNDRFADALGDGLLAGYLRNLI